MKDPKVTKLAAKLNEKSISALIIPTQDYHQSEYVCSRDRRLEYVSSFTGSAGQAVVCQSSSALLWTDGRYWNQAEHQLHPSWELMRSGQPGVQTVEEYLLAIIKKGEKVGVDPLCYSVRQWQKLETTLKKQGVELVEAQGVVDDCWEDQPEAPSGPINVQLIDYAGESPEAKVAKLRQEMKKSKLDVFVVAALDDIAWLFNLRGCDIPCNPVFFAFAIVSQTSCFLCANHQRLQEPAVASHFQELKGAGLEVTLVDYSRFTNALRDSLHLKATVGLDDKCNYHIYQICLQKGLDAKQVKVVDSPIALAKAQKNTVEIQRSKEAHITDAVALTKYFCWLDQTYAKNVEQLDEADLAQKLENFRAEAADFKGISFDTISSYGPNGAVVHYKPEKDSERCLQVGKDSLYLCDSGGHYLGGTTDITRTVHLGEPTAEEKKCFTLVLEGHCELAQAIFPKKTLPHTLDVLARLPLWKNGLDYNHGTGHGVGAYLNVHEFPPLISAKASGKGHPLMVGNVLSNEPGYYKDGHFGIRIENVMVVQASKVSGYLQFETISMFPIQQKLIDTELLSQSALDWVNDYHRQCWIKLAPHFPAGSNEHQWLLQATRPMTRSTPSRKRHKPNEA